jgi:hypothetical protein
MIEALANEIEVTTVDGKWAGAVIGDFRRARFGRGQVAPVSPATPALQRTRASPTRR